MTLLSFFLLIGLDPSTASIISRIRRRALRSHIKVEIDKTTIKMDGLRVEEIALVLNQLEPDVEDSRAPVRPDPHPGEENRRRIVEYSVMRNAAENWLAPYLPANPRRAKRLINHERLYAMIAEDRGVFGGEPALTHHHLAKWVLIVEHWPRLASALVRDPGTIEVLERAGNVDELRDALTAVPGVYASTELVQVLREGIPLTAVLPRLVRFEPAAAVASSSQNPVDR
jgi:hypothetical protein